MNSTGTPSGSETQVLEVRELLHHLRRHELGQDLLGEELGDHGPRGYGPDVARARTAA